MLGFSIEMTLLTQVKVLALLAFKSYIFDGLIGVAKVASVIEYILFEYVLMERGIHGVIIRCLIDASVFTGLDARLSELRLAEGGKPLFSFILYDGIYMFLFRLYTGLMTFY